MDKDNTASHLRLMGFDVDGVMTDGRLYFGAEGESLKVFNSLDGHGLKMLQQAGIELVIISGRRSEALIKRARELGITELHMQIQDKRRCMQILAEKRNLQTTHLGYMGDDVVDLAVLKYCAFSAAPATAHAMVIKQVNFVTQAAGGLGAVREVCDHILQAQNKMNDLMADYLRA